MSKSVKITLALTNDEIGNSPISSESLWCKVEENGLRLNNIPMFKEGLSVGDLVRVTSKDGSVGNSIEILKKSKNSTVWIYVKNSSLDKDIVKIVRELGCNIEGGSPAGNYAINVPQEIDLGDIANSLKQYVSKEQILIDYPSVRHK